MASETLLSAGIGLIGAMIGATIAGVCSYWVTREQIESQRRQDKEEIERKARGNIRMYIFNIEQRVLDIENILRLSSYIDFGGIKLTQTDMVNAVKKCAEKYNNNLRRDHFITSDVEFIDSKLLSSVFLMEYYRSCVDDLVLDFSVYIDLVHKHHRIIDTKIDGIDLPYSIDDQCCGLSIECVYDKLNDMALNVINIIGEMKSILDIYDIDQSSTLMNINCTSMIHTYSKQYEQFKKQWQE